MNSVETLVLQLGAILLSRSAASFFINGGPGTGKSHLLTDLSTKIPSAIPGTIVVGPHLVTPSNINDLAALQMKACSEAGFLDTMPPREQVRDIADSWAWLEQLGQFSSRQVFLVLVDLDSDVDLTAVAALFSRARCLEAVWGKSGACLLYVLAGSWNTIELIEYCDREGTSFPYTSGRNYVVWEGISPDTMISLVQRQAPNSLWIHQQVLYELTGGNPTVALEILKANRNSRLSVKKLLDATHKVAVNGQMGHRWLKQWPRFSPQAQQVVQKLLYQRYVPDPDSIDFVDQLITLGIVRRREIGRKRYLQFSSWYMELLFRSHLDAIGMDDTDLTKVQIQEMVPPIAAINREAYEIIHEIENSVRDFAVLWLSMHNTGQTHILAGRVLEYVDKIDRQEDLYERAAFWCQRSESAGLPKGLNPLLAYCSMRDLASLLDEIGRVSCADPWQDIAEHLRKLADIRDAVMHNQLIDDEQFLSLTELQEAVYCALSQA